DITRIVADANSRIDLVVRALPVDHGLTGGVEDHQAIDAHPTALETDAEIWIERVFEATHVVAGKRIDNGGRAGFGAGLREDQLMQEHEVVALLLNQLIAQIASDLRKLIIQPLLRRPNNQ